MFERFTGRARQTVVFAQEEARLLRHNYIGTEHLLLGLLHDPDGLGARALGRLSIELEPTRADVVDVVGTGGEEPSGHIPFTPRAKKVLELSLREAIQLGHNYIGTEHILLGLTREGEGVAAQVLAGRCGNLDRVRTTVLSELKQHGLAAHDPVRPPLRTPAAEEALAAATELAARGPIGSQHLLEALARSPDSAAGRVFASLGIDPDTLAAAIDEIGIDDTTDTTPTDAAARQIHILRHDDEVHVVLRDRATIDLVGAITEQLGGDIHGDDPATGSLVGLWQALTTELESLKDRVTPQPVDATETTRTSIVRQAIRNRITRRRDH